MSVSLNIQLINQICAKSGLQGKDLENLRTNLAKLSRSELQAELLKFLVSSDSNNQNKGLEVEQNPSVMLLDNYQKTDYYDKKGNIVTEYKDGNYVIERIIKGKDDLGNEFETTITYKNNRPFTKIVKRNGEKEEITSYTYHDKSKTNFIPSVTVETTKSDNTVVKSEVLKISGYDGDFDLSNVIERETTKPNGTVTNLSKILNFLVETVKRPDGTALTTYYNGVDINACDNSQLHKVRQTLKPQGQEAQELNFDGKGNTIVTANAGDGWEKLARRFHTTEKKLKELNPKIKNLKAGQDILIPNEFDIESKEIGKVQPREEAAVQAWNAEVDRQIAQKVTENIDKNDAQELKKVGINANVENYIFYQKFSKLNPSQKQNVLSMVKYYKAQGITDLNTIKNKILETYPDVNLFDSGKTINVTDNSVPFALKKPPIALETFITDYLKLNLNTEPGKTVYGRLALMPQEKLDRIVASKISDMSKANFETIANMFSDLGVNILTESEYRVTKLMSEHSKQTNESELRSKTVDFAYKTVHQAKEILEAHLAELKDHYIKNAGEIIWDGLKIIGNLITPEFKTISLTSGSGQYEAIVKNIGKKIDELDKLENDLIVLKSNVNSSDFEAQYKKLLKTDYNPDKIQTLMVLSKNQPDKNSSEYAVYEKQMENAIKDVTGKDFTKNVSSFINWSKGAGSLVETAIFCFVTAGMGSVVTVGGKAARAVTVMGKTFNTATRSGATKVMATIFGKYAAARAGLNFIDDIDNLLAPMTLEEMLKGRKDITLGGMFVGENNADQIRESLSAVKSWATGEITRDEAEAIIKKNFKSLSFDDFVSSNGGQFVLNTATSSIFGAAAGAASPWFQKAGEIGTKWGQRLGLNAPTVQQVTADLLAKNPAGINAAEFMAKTYEALHATNIVGKGLQFLVETAVFYCTNLPLSLIQEKLSESNGELEKAVEEGRLGSYLISRFGEEALNLMKVKSIGTIIAMVMGTTNIAQLKGNFEDYDVLKNTTIRCEETAIQLPDGTQTNGRVIVVEGTTGKLYIDGNLAKFYSTQGKLLTSENMEAPLQYDGITVAYVLGKFMQMERQIKANPIQPEVVNTPETVENQTIQALEQVAGQQKPQITVIPQTSNKPVSGDGSGTPAVENPINQPNKRPYTQPKVEVLEMELQQIAATSIPQQTVQQQNEPAIETVSSTLPKADNTKVSAEESRKEGVQEKENVPTNTEQRPIEEIEQEFLDMLSDSEKPRWEKAINGIEQYKNSSYEEKVQAISFWLNQAKLTGLLKDNYVPELGTVQQKLEFIEDTKIRSYIESELNKLNTLPEAARTEKLLELEYLEDAINNLNGHYSMIHTQSSLLDNPAAQAHRIQAINNNSGGELNYSPEAQARIDEHIKYDGIKNFIAKYAGSNPEMAEYLYTQYLNTLSPEVSAKCDEISKKTGVKIFVDNTDTELMKHLNEIQDEYTLWKNAGLKVPNILDEFDVSTLFVLPELQGEGVPVAFTKPELNWQALSICNIKEQELDMRSMLRHELTHLNDPNFNDTIWDENNPIHNEILTNREKYAQYLKDAGANDYMVEYAFSMPREFSAVAMQLDTSKYPDEFKTLLAKMGVPKKALDFEPVTSNLPKENDTTVKQQGSEVKPESAVQISQDKPDWASFKADRAKVTQVLLSQVEDKAAFEKFKTTKGYETNEDAIIPFLKRLKMNDTNFKLSYESKKILDDFIKKYDKSGFMPDAEFDTDYLNNYHRTSYIYNSKHEMAYHDLTQRIFDIRRKFDLDNDENFDLEKLHEKLENLPTEKLNDLRRMFNEYDINSKEDALRILNTDFSKIEIETVKSMLEDNDLFSYFALADFVFSTPEEFTVKHQRLLSRKADLPKCEYENDKKQWSAIMNMSDEDYEYYKASKDTLPEGITSSQLHIYQSLIAQDAELTTTLLGMKKKKFGIFGNEVPRFTIDEIAQLFEAIKIDRALTLELINKQHVKGGFSTGYAYNNTEDIIKIVELTKTYDRNEIEKLVSNEKIYTPEQIETLLKLKAQDSELYEIFVNNGYSIDMLDDLQECLTKNPTLTKELMQNKEYSISDIKSLVDCDEKNPEITKYLFEKVDENGRIEDRFVKYDKVKYAEYVLNCTEEQLKFFMYCLEARDPDGRYRFSYNIKDICKLHEEHPQELQELLDFRFKDIFTGEEKYLYEGVLIVMMPCYLEDKATALEAINTNPSMSCYSMEILYNLLRSPDKDKVRELLKIKKADDTNIRRFNVEDIKNLLPLKDQDPIEFEKMLNTKAFQNGKVVDAYDADFIQTYIGTPYNIVKHLMNLTIKGKDGNEYKMLTGSQIKRIHEFYADPASDKALLDEIIYIPKYKAILPALTKKTAPVFCNRQLLDLLDKSGIEKATGIALSPKVDGKFLLIIKFGDDRKTFNISIDKDENITVTGDETSYKRDDKNLIRRNFDDGSYLVEEISYVDALDGDGGKAKLAYSKKKTWFDKDGVQTRSEVVIPVEGEPGEFTINVYERGLNEQMVKKTVGSVKISEDDEGKTVKVEKTYTAPDGTITRQTKTTDPNGASSAYEITAVENGEKKVLFSQKRSFVKLDENHYTSSIDGQIYDIKFSNDGVTVSKLDDEGKPFETITLGTDVLDTQLMGLFKQLPGDTFFLIHKIGINRIYLDEHIKNNAHYSFDKNTIEISRELMNDPFVFMHELHHAVSHNMFGDASQNKKFGNAYTTDLNNYQAESANQEELIAGYFSSKYHGTEQGQEEAFAEIGAIISGVDVSAAANEVLGMRSLIVQQNMARTIATEADMIKEGMSKPLPPRKEVPSFTMLKINGTTTSPREEDTTVSSQNSTDGRVRRSDAPQGTEAPEVSASAILSKSEFIEKLSIINKYLDEFNPEDDPEIELFDDMESFGNSAYEIYKQDPEIFNMILEGKDFNGNPIPEKTSVYLMIAAIALKTIKNTSQLRNIVVLLSLYENTDTMKYSSSLGISETDFNLLVAIEKDRSDVQGDWRFASGVPAGFTEIYEALIKDMNDVQKRTLTIMLQEGAVSYTDLPELNRRFMTIKTEQDAEEFGKLFKEILPKNEIRPRAVTLLVDKITSPEMKELADKLLDLFEPDLPASSTRLVNIMEAAHLGAYERIVELLENPTKENKEEIRLFGCAVDKSKEKVELLEQSGILKDRRFSAEQLDNISLEQLYHIIERDLLSSEKNYSAMDILHLADANDKTYNQIVKYDLMKDFTAFDAKSIVENIDDIQEYDLLKYRKILTGKTMTDLCYFPELRKDFINYPQIQKLGPLGADAMNEIINGNLSEERKQVHDFGRELCDDVQAGKLNKYDCNELYLSVETENLDFVRELYQNMTKYHLSIDELIEIAKVTVLKGRIPIARRMVEDRNFPNSLIRPVLRCADEDNMDILEKTCFDPEFPKEYIRDILNFTSQDKNNAKAINGLLDNPELKQWFIMNLKNDLTPDLIVHLARTQKKLNIEAQQSRAHRSNAPQSQEAQGAEIEEAKPQDVQDAIDKMVKLGMNAKMAEKAYVKLCQDKGGNIDKVKLNAVLALVEAFGINSYINDEGNLRTNPNISPKEIQEIFAFAVGSALSSANGQFRPDIIKDIIRLRQAGVTDVKLATTLSCIKNMGLVEMKDRFNTKVREDAVKRAEELPEDVKSAIENTGFDLTAVLEKASAEAKGGKVKRVNLETVTLRSLDDIYGDEKILISKHKSDKDFNQKIWGDPDKFREWAEKRVADLMDFDKNPNYTTTFGDAKSINAERKQRLQEWYDYLTKKSDYKDNPFVHCLILEEITKELRSDNAATIKPVSPALFNEVHGILIDENNDMSFDTLYSQKMREKAISLYSHGIQTVDGIEGQWVTIPQTQKGDPNYDEHVAMVQSLAEGSSWCLKASNANNYIQSGHIHYFIDKDGKAQIAMHEENGEITQIQKRYKQDSSVPVPYVEVIEQYYKDNNLHGLRSSIQAAKYAKPNFEKLKAEVTKLMEQEDYLAVFDALEIKVKVKDDGTYVLNQYDPQITTQYTIADLGIDEDKLMENVSEIEHDMNLDGSNLTEMKNLRKVGGVIKFGDNKISDVRNLEKVHGLKISWIKAQTAPTTPGKNAQTTVQTSTDAIADAPQDLRVIPQSIHAILQNELPKFNEYDATLQTKIVNTLIKLDEKLNPQLSNLFKGILAYVEDSAVIEKICDDDNLLNEIQKNAQTVMTIFENQKDLDKEIRNRIFFNLLLMKHFYPENYDKLINSDTYKEIESGNRDIKDSQNVRYSDTYKIAAIKGQALDEPKPAETVTQPSTRPITPTSDNGIIEGTDNTQNSQSEQILSVETIKAEIDSIETEEELQAYRKHLGRTLPNTIDKDTRRYLCNEYINSRIDYVRKMELFKNAKADLEKLDSLKECFKFKKEWWDVEFNEGDKAKLWAAYTKKEKQVKMQSEILNSIEKPATGEDGYIDQVQYQESVKRGFDLYNANLLSEVLRNVKTKADCNYLEYCVRNIERISVYGRNMLLRMIKEKKAELLDETEESSDIIDWVRSDMYKEFIDDYSLKYKHVWVEFVEYPLQNPLYLSLNPLIHEINDKFDAHIVAVGEPKLVKDKETGEKRLEGNYGLRGRNLITFGKEKSDDKNAKNNEENKLGEEFFDNAKAAGLTCIIDLRAKAGGNIRIKKDKITEIDGKTYIDGVEYYRIPLDHNDQSDGVIDKYTIKKLGGFFQRMEREIYYIGCANGMHRTDYAFCLNYALNTKTINTPKLESLDAKKSEFGNAIRRIYNKIQDILTEAKTNPQLLEEYNLTPDLLERLPKSEAELEERIKRCCS